VTALVGIFCKDGVVIGADSAATSATAGGQRTIEQPVMKIEIVADRIIIAGTGQIGMGQRFCHQVRTLWENKRLSAQDEFGFAKIIAQAAIQDFAETKCSQGQYGALVAFPCRSGPHLVEYAVADFQPEFKSKNLWYVSMGSGQTSLLGRRSADCSRSDFCHNMDARSCGECQSRRSQWADPNCDHGARDKVTGKRDS
jgi:20S proteasome alpha/beta subunit